MVTCWEKSDLFALVGNVFCIFVTFPCGILGQVWYFIVSFPDLCLLSYFYLYALNTSELRVRLVPFNMFKHLSFQVGAPFVDPFLLFVFHVCLCYTVVSVPYAV